VPDLKCIGAGGRIISLLPGGSYCSSETSFGLIRGGHVDATVLGALEVDQNGSIANWMVPGKSIPGMGGAMDLVIGAPRVYVAMAHATKKGTPKILKKCTLPLTAVGVVTMIVTEFVVFRFEDGRMTLIEKAPEVTLDQIREHTEAEFETIDPLPVIKGMEGPQ
jgi:3-oxoacid CoA-transferase subunit B/acetate CoA/acetoacetate CoA-transferase beta subunit